MSHKEIKIQATDSNFIREKLKRPFGFKGGYLTELWQTIAGLRSSSGHYKVGLATQSVLYGDPDLFASYSESSGNALMFFLTEKALQLLKSTSFQNPIDLQEQILPVLMQEAFHMSGRKQVNINFIFNALVGLDNAAWLVYAAEKDIHSFGDMIPEIYRKALSTRNEKIAIMYQVSYGMPLQEIESAVDAGYFVIKIKTGQAGSEEEMLEKDMLRFREIHHLLKEKKTSQTENGKLIYTLDANGRYQNKESIRKFVKMAESIGAKDQILLYEEPFHESVQDNVGDLGISIAADESLHDENDALRKIEKGYSAFVLKGIAKTLSQTLKIVKVASENNIPCLCSDLTVNPLLVNWHKNLAAHLTPFPGLSQMTLMETNGDMNYVNWERMRSILPYADAEWNQRKDGVFYLTQDFYDKSGGIFESVPFYESQLHI